MARGARLITLAMTILVTAGLAVYSVAGPGPSGCATNEFTGLLSFELVTSAVAGFVLGHILGQWVESTNPSADRPPVHVTRPPGQDHELQLQTIAAAGTPEVVSPTARKRSNAAAIVVQSMLVLFLATAALLLLYETSAVIGGERNWPITLYIRCFAHLHSDWAMLGAFAVCFLLGHWIWYPARAAKAQS